MVSNGFHKDPLVYLEGTGYKKVHWTFIQLTLLVMYNDRLCSLFYTTNFLKDGCFACIGSSYDKNSKMGTSVLIPEHCDILHMCSCKGPVIFVFWWKDNIDPPDAVAPVIFAITNVSTSKKGCFYKCKGQFVQMAGSRNDTFN